MLNARMRVPKISDSAICDSEPTQQLNTLRYGHHRRMETSKAFLQKLYTANLIGKWDLANIVRRPSWKARSVTNWP